MYEISAPALADSASGHFWQSWSRQNFWPDFGIWPDFSDFGAVEVDYLQL